MAVLYYTNTLLAYVKVLFLICIDLSTLVPNMISISENVPIVSSSMTGVIDVAGTAPPSVAQNHIRLLWGLF